jgi:S1-C subfamily serine protease
MRKATVVAFLLLALAFIFAPAVRAQGVSVTKPQIDHLYNSVALLYTQTEAGDMRMTCSVTAFAVKPEVPAKQDGKELAATGSFVYRFVSAAHCVEGSNDKQQKLQKFYITTDSKGTKAYLPAKLIETGDKATGDDFSLFEVTTAEKFEVTPLGDSDKLVYGDSVIDVSGALGMGKQFFEGYVSETHLDRPPLNAGTVQWTDIMLIQIGGGPGSSGSAIVSTTTNSIVGFLVGKDPNGDNGFICVPVAKFNAFVKAVDAGTYKKTKKSDDNAEPGDSDQSR